MSNDTLVLNILKNLLAVIIESKQPIGFTSCQSHGESWNLNLVKSKVEDGKTRLNIQFVSKNTFNLSH